MKCIQHFERLGEQLQSGVTLLAVPVCDLPGQLWVTETECLKRLIDQLDSCHVPLAQINLVPVTGLELVREPAKLVSPSIKELLGRLSLDRTLVKSRPETCLRRIPVPTQGVVKVEVDGLDTLEKRFSTHRGDFATFGAGREGVAAT